ncbi:MAG TPA: hypothetical protein P5526_25520 [Anaerolineae bacterium]|nr:hypothetical protein [Anaerolineae bacterium]
MAAPQAVIFSQQGRRPRRRCIFAADHAFEPAVAAFTAAMSTFRVRKGLNFSHYCLWASRRGIFFSVPPFGVEKKANFYSNCRLGVQTEA